jgi:hypothetical protein
MKTRAAQIDESALIERLQTEPPELVLDRIPVVLADSNDGKHPLADGTMRMYTKEEVASLPHDPLPQFRKRSRGQSRTSIHPRSCFRLKRRRKCLSEQRMPCAESCQRASKSPQIASCWSAGSRLRNFSQSANAELTISLRPGVCQLGESVGGF